MIVFVCGTDTGIGKTRVACALVRFYRSRGRTPGVMKPVATGAARRNGRRFSRDAIKLMRVAGCPARDYEKVNPVLYDPPISPHLAARLAGLPVRVSHLREHIHNMERRSGVLVVEGIGGVATPLTDRVTWADLMSGIQPARVILVCSPRVGTLNHTLMSLEYLSRRKIHCMALVISNHIYSNAAHQQNRRELRRLTGLPVLTCPRGSTLLKGNLAVLTSRVRC